MKRCFFIVSLLLYGSFTFAQNQSNLYYWITFKDKLNSPYSLSNPLQFLTQQSLDRRNNQHIALDSSDLPITPVYISSILPYTAEVVHQLKWFNMIVVKITDSTLVDSIKQFSFVDSIAPIISLPYKMLNAGNKFELVTPVNQQIIYPDVHGIAYHQINMMNADLLHQLGYRGQGMLIAMMDNGCNGVDTLHAFDSVRPRILDSWNFVDNQKSIYTDPGGGHGTNTFSCMAGNLPYQYVGSAPDANFLLYHTEDNAAEWVMEEYNWVAGAERADSMGAWIFSTSLGYSTFDNNLGNHTYSDLSGNRTMITQAGNRAFAKGILVFNSAGNEGQQPWYHIIAPADADSIITVGAVDSARDVAAFSSRGPNAAGRIKPDVCAQGAVVAVINILGAPGTSGGTSFSCPLLAGCAACLWQAFPDKTAREIKDAIIISADNFWTPDNNHGYGIPNFYNAYLLLKTNYNGQVLRISSDAAVYPNPFTTQLNVSLYNTDEGNRTIELFDMLGNKLFSKQVYLQNTFEIVSFDDVAGLPDGEYFLRIDGKKQFAHRVIKIK